MSRWVLLLLVIYMTLGLSRMAPAKATRLALVITVMVVGFVLVRTAAHG
jgi:hypothetical protein